MESLKDDDLIVGGSGVLCSVSVIVYVIMVRAKLLVSCLWHTDRLACWQAGNFVFGFLALNVWMIYIYIYLCI